MSHTSKIELEVKDIEALKEAAKALGMELVEKKTYKWYGTYMRDWPLPAGVTEKDLGKCDYALRIPNDPHSYEVGVVRDKADPSRFNLLFDFWAGGGNLTKHVGKQGEKLMQQYPLEVARKHLRARGRRVVEERTADGRAILRGKR